jgi:predicted nucleic acid-binding protein
MPLVLIDTNLLMYLMDQNEPDKQELAGKILHALEDNRSGRLGAQNLAEFINASMRKLSPPLTPQQAMAQAARFSSHFPVFPLTEQIVFEAVRGVRDYGLAYYDSQIWAAARLNQVPVIFSEDFQDGQVLESVRFVNPFIPQFNLEQWF